MAPGLPWPVVTALWSLPQSSHGLLPVCLCPPGHLHAGTMLLDWGPTFLQYNPILMNYVWDQPISTFIGTGGLDFNIYRLVGYSSTHNSVLTVKCSVVEILNCSLLFSGDNLNLHFCAVGRSPAHLQPPCLSWIPFTLSRQCCFSSPVQSGLRRCLPP